MSSIEHRDGCICPMLWQAISQKIESSIFDKDKIIENQN